MNEKIVTLSKKEIKKLKKQGLSDEEIEKVKQETEKKTEVKPEPPKPTTDELLAEILVELKKSNNELPKNVVDAVKGEEHN